METTEVEEVLKNKTYHFSSSDLVNVVVGVCLSLLPLPRLETGSHYVPLAGLELTIRLTRLA